MNRDLFVAGEDLNLRPLGYEPSELPSCSTPRRQNYVTSPAREEQIRPPRTGTQHSFRLVRSLFDIGFSREGFFQRLLQLVLRRAVGSEVTSLESFIRLRECVTRLGEGRS